MKLRRLGFGEDPFPLAFSGGVLVASGRLQMSLASHLTAMGLHPDPVTRVAAPVAGAVKLALEEVCAR